MGLSVHSSDQDVTLYLKELKNLYIQILDTEETQLQNCQALVEYLKTAIDSEKLLEQDKNSYILKQYADISALIVSIENKYKNNIDIRYSGYKKATQNVVTFSGFMNITHYEMGQEIEKDTKQLVNLNRQKTYLESILAFSDSRILYLTELKTELTNMNFNV